MTRSGVVVRAWRGLPREGDRAGAVVGVDTPGQAPGQRWADAVLVVGAIHTGFNSPAADDVAGRRLANA